MIFWSGHVKIHHVQGQEWQLRFAGVAVRRCHMSKVRSCSCAWLERLWGDTPRQRAKEKPQQEGRRGQIHTENQTPSLPETLRGLKQTLCSSGPRDPTETETQLCLSIFCGGTGQQWPATGARALGAAELGVA